MNEIHFRTALAVLSITLFPLAVKLDAQSLQRDPQLESRLQTLIEKADIPGVGVAVMEQGRLARLSVAGRRKHNDERPITIHDQFHLGSCTKAMTAAMIATLVEDGKLDWDSKLMDVVPELKQGTHPDYRNVNLEQLLTHSAGVSANAAWRTGGGSSNRDNLLKIFRAALKAKPPHAPGQKFLYSNLGYALAAQMASAVSGRDWQSLMQDRLFKPLDMKTAGFGPPGNRTTIDQPWGHRRIGQAAIALFQDNPPSLGPAGRVHCSLSDWAKFVSIFTHQGKQSQTLLRPETIDRLLQPGAGDYACGWIVRKRGENTFLSHAGSNSLWISIIKVSCNDSRAILAVANIAPEVGEAALEQLIQDLSR